MKTKLFARLCAIGFAAIALEASALPLPFSGSSGSLAASISFELIGGKLKVVLTNTSAADVLVPADVLTAVFFNIAGNPTLNRVSGISGGNTYLNGAVVNPAGTVVGGEWGYLNGLSQYSANSGISSSGLGIFGSTDVFPGPNLSGPASPDGLQYGLTSAGDIVTTGNAAVLGNELTKNFNTFWLDGLPLGFTLASISNVTFQYGTALDEGHFGSDNGNFIPEPSTIALLGLGLAVFGAARRRKA